MTSEYPEHDKLHAVKLESQAIGDFLFWLIEDQKVTISKSHKHDGFCFNGGKRVCETADGALVLVNFSISDWLVRYFDIDTEKLETEKLSMLDKCRSGESPLRIFMASPIEANLSRKSQ